MDDQRKQNLFIPLRPEKLLYARQFYPLDGQILFWYEEWQEYVITVISEEQTYTADDYNLLPEGAPFQLIHGKLIFMASPTDIHQKLLLNISTEINMYVKSHNLGEVRFAPLDVYLDDINVVQPDLFFVSVKRNNIIKRKVFGAPDFIVEILSAGTQNIDQTLKKQLYGKYGVLEYWLVHPTDKSIHVYYNENKKMELVKTAYSGDTIISSVIKGLELEVDKIFE